MKMLKKLLAVAFCGVMACALVGCQNQEPQQNDEDVQVSDAAAPTVIKTSLPS